MKRWREDIDGHVELRRADRIGIDTESMWETCQQSIALSFGDQKTALILLYFEILHLSVAQVASASQDMH